MITQHELSQRLAVIETNAAKLIREANDAWTEIRILHQRLALLADQGMYCFAEDPLEIWETRNGSEPKYLRLRFHETPRHCPYIDVPTPYDGPHGQRQIYIGADPQRIAEARRLIANRNQWLLAQTDIQRHEATITRIWRQLIY